MSTSLENYAEQVEVLMLQGQSALAGLSVVREDEDADAARDRIVVKAEPREVELYGKDPTIVVFWRIPLTVTVHLVTRSAATMDTYIAAVEAANNSAAPAPAITLATAQFPLGFQIENTDEGNRDHSDNARTRAKTFRVIAHA